MSQREFLHRIVLNRGVVQLVEFDPLIVTDLPLSGNAGDVLHGDGTWAPISGSGTVTSVALAAPIGLFTVSGSPVTSSGTLTLGLDVQVAGTIFAGPGSGPAAQPTFRTLLGTDLPLFDSTNQGAVPASGGGTTNFLRADGTWVSPAGGVTSVSNSDGSLTISPTTGAVVASINVGHQNTWTAQQHFTGTIGVHIFGSTEAGIQLDPNNSHACITWGNIPGTIGSNTVFNAGIYPDAANANIELQLAGGIVSAPGNDALGKLRCDLADINNPMVYVGGSETIIAGSSHQVRLRLFNVAGATTYWEVYDDNGSQLRFNKYVASVLTYTISLPQQSGEVVVASGRTVSGTASLAVSDRYVLIDTSAGAANVSLYPAFGLPAGTRVVLKVSGGSQANLSVQGGGTIDGQTGLTILGDQNYLEIFSDGSTWRAVANDQWLMTDVGVGVAKGTTTQALTVARAVSGSLLGYNSVRLGVAATDQPCIVWETTGHKGRHGMINNGTLFWTNDSDNVLAAFTQSGNFGIGGSLVPDASCAIDLQQTTVGLGLNSLTTTQQNNITSPRTGLLIYNSTLAAPTYYNGSTWKTLSTTTGTVTSVATGTGLTGGPITTSGTISLDGSYTFLTLSGHALTFGSTLNLAASDVSLGNVTNDTQTKAAIVPNTAPGAGQILVGNAGGTAYAPVSVSGDGSLASTGALTVNAYKTIQGNGTAQTARTVLNFRGGGTIARDNSGTSATDIIAINPSLLTVVGGAL